MPVTYSSYLKIDELLNLQECQSEGPEHDEMLFILIHQVNELWFKEILHELDFLTQMLRKKRTYTGAAYFEPCAENFQNFSFSTRCSGNNDTHGFFGVQGFSNTCLWISKRSISTDRE